MPRANSGSVPVSRNADNDRRDFLRRLGPATVRSIDWFGRRIGNQYRSIDIDTVFAPRRSRRKSALPGGVAITLAVGLVGFFWLRQKLRNLTSQRALTVTLHSISQGILMVGGCGGVSVISSRVLDLLGWSDEP